MEILNERNRKDGLAQTEEKNFRRLTTLVSAPHELHHITVTRIDCMRALPRQALADNSRSCAVHLWQSAPAKALCEALT
jgi:hypothetical protein